MRRKGNGPATPDPAAARRLLDEAALHLLSCKLWRVDAGWSIPRRSVPDTFLFVPLAGRLEVEARGGTHRLVPGSLLLLPDHEPHAVRYAPGCSTLDVVALHLHATWRDGTPVAAGFADPVGPLPDAGRWQAGLVRLARLAALDGGLGASYGRLEGLRLLADLLLAGWRHRPPAPAADPRIAAAADLMRREPGAGHAIAGLARRSGLSPVRFRLLFRRQLGVPPKLYLDRLRLARAAELLRGGARVAETARLTGFATLRQLESRFRSAYGVTPSRWRDGPVGP